MKLGIIIIILSGLGLSVSGCRIIEVPDKPAIITQQATPCFGACPAYTIHIYNNRTVTLKAEKFLRMEGDFVARLKQKELDRLVQLFDSRIFDFKDEYTAQISDMPSVYLTFNYNNRQKQILDYYGAPEELKQLEHEVFALINKLNWKKMAP